MVAGGLINAWIVTGPVFGFSDTWQLVINTGTTIITFLMVSLIQKTQNKDSKALQLKLNELIATSRRASNRMVDIEDLTEEELDVLHKFYQRLSEKAKAPGTSTNHIPLILRTASISQRRSLAARRTGQGIRIERFGLLLIYPIQLNFRNIRY
ncbi:low affinity iron permease family protein [Anseongella ginsenosidimutans]|uniref:low affinity iron permease family protein n=1 Tax=Anseongella ginsenosidimutans TaxID=496056 RepID=UPI0029390DD9|nr:low affinity iron permease family protein [Anseongella ginsenosidimutans]